MLSTVQDKGYAEQRIKAYNASIKDHRDAIKKLEAKRDTLKEALANTPTDDDTPTDDAAGAVI